MQYLPFCDWLMSLSIMCSQFIHIVTNRRIFFIFKAKQYTLHVYTTFSLSINLLMDMGRFCILLTVNNTAMNLGEETTLPCAQLCNLQPHQDTGWFHYHKGFLCSAPSQSNKPLTFTSWQVNLISLYIVVHLPNHHVKEIAHSVTLGLIHFT